MCYFCSLSVAVCSQRILINEATVTPKIYNEKEQALLMEGNKCHDDGEYLAAVDAYNKLIALNPNNPLAYYEKSYSLMVLGENKKSLKAILQATKYKSENPFQIYLQLGNSLDNNNYHTEALDAYDKALEIDTSNYLVYFNKAITLIRLNRIREGQNNLRRSLKLNPDHAGSNLVLATTYSYDGYTIPALMAYCRYLMIEPVSPRAESAITGIQKIINSAVSQTGGKEYNIVLPSIKQDYDGNFYLVQLMMSLLTAGQIAKAAEADTLNAGKYPTHFLIKVVEILKGIFQEMLELEEKEDFSDSGFAWKYYAPYFIEMQREDLVEPFVYYIFQSTQDEYVKEWLKEHEQAVESLKIWNEKFQLQLN